MYSKVVLTVFIILMVIQPVGMSRNVAYGSKEEPSISLRLSIKSPICRGSTLRAEAEVLNLGAKSILIDPELIWYRTSFKYIKPSEVGMGNGGNRTIVLHPGTGKQSYIEIAPGQAYKASRVFPLDDEFFTRARAFEMSITYGQFQKADEQALNLFAGTVSSNKVPFSLPTCRSRKRGKERVN